ncbi:amino acid ABC transporter permease [Nocardia colli]|uniref:Amino acid ABC transporter permease n=1 Tax=Nocardia colli TaxID=2545717 RepID=A0A5N0DUJ7_9NOCA|nr:amino acid ABC transporter permease [Nocardia colli]KAA8879675.1 amino acid ABC transporter permease [Nocardia colli]
MPGDLRTVRDEAPAVTLLPKVPLRHWGRWVSGVLILVLLGALGFAMSQGQIDYASIPALLTEPIILEGLVNTILLAVVAQAGAIVLGVVVALMRASRNPVARWFASGYIWLFRGLPVLLQILLWFNLAFIFPRITILIPFVDVTLLDQSANTLMTVFVAALLGLGLNESAYMAEIVRAGLNSVDKGQVEAAQSIGMPPSTVLRRVILPQAMRVIIPPTGNDFINMLKGTSMASVIGYLELIKAAQNLTSHSLNPMETLFTVAIWYMVVVSVASVGQYFLERRYSASDRSNGGRTPWRRIGRSLGTPPMVRTTP